MKALLIILLLLPITLFSQNEKEETIITSTETIDSTEQVIAISPEFTGGPNAMELFIRDNFIYPERARLMGEQGTIWVEFVVYSSGYIYDVKIVKGVSPSLDAESLRIVRHMPKWKPGEQNGKKVNVRYTIPITAKLEMTAGQKRRQKRKEKKKKKKELRKTR